ncbi:hypothetical protein GCM10027444_06320 [Actinopolyspora lacussalsi]
MEYSDKLESSPPCAFAVNSVESFRAEIPPGIAFPTAPEGRYRLPSGSYGQHARGLGDRVR